MTIRSPVRGPVRELLRSPSYADADSASAPVNTVAPVIGGTGYVGAALTITSYGLYSGYPAPADFTVQWQKNGVDISGQTGASYTVVVGDVGANITAVVVATNASGSSSPTSSNAIVALASSAPAFTVAAAISGTRKPGNTLTCDGGTATGTPAPTKTYQWQKDGVNISGATNATYVVQAGDVASSITCDVTATNFRGSATSTSNALSIISDPAVTVAPVIAGTMLPHETLTCDGGSFSGYPTPTKTYQWTSDGVDIGGATSATFELTWSEVDTDIQCKVTATNTAGSVVGTSNTKVFPAATLDTPTLSLGATFDTTVASLPLDAGFVDIQVADTVQLELATVDTLVGADLYNNVVDTSEDATESLSFQVDALPNDIYFMAVWFYRPNGAFSLRSSTVEAEIAVPSSQARTAVFLLLGVF